MITNTIGPSGKIMENIRNSRNSFLDRGKIPAGKNCPFLTACSFKNQNCPGIGATKANPFGCGMARAFDLTKEH